MSMFSGLTNQISGWVANKTGGAADPNADPNAAAAAAVDPNDPNAQYQQNGAEGVEGVLLHEHVVVDHEVERRLEHLVHSVATVLEGRNDLHLDESSPGKFFLIQNR